jgi:hypothetical protein
MQVGILNRMNGMRLVLQIAPQSASFMETYKSTIMKKLLLILLVFAAFSAQAQKVDSVKNALQVKPVVINVLNKDTLYQVTWSVFGISRNDTSGANSYVQLYDRKGKRVQEMNVRIPYSILSVWLDDVVIDNYILTFLGLTKR